MAKKHIVAVVGTRGIPKLLGGIETHCQKLYPRILKTHPDFEIHLYARKYYTTHSKNYTYKGVFVHPIPCIHKSSLEALSHTFLCWFYILHLKPDIVHIHGIGNALFVPFYRLLGAKVVYTHHGQDYLRQKWGKLAKFMLKTGERVGTFFANKIIVISEGINHFLKNKYKTNRTVLIRNGVDIPKRNAENEAEWLTRHMLKPNKYVFSLGRFVEEKGFHDLIEACENLPEGIKLVIAGGADHESEYSLKLKRFAKENNVILPGIIKGEELTAFFGNARLFVLPSYHEGLPIALLEALSYNLNVLVSDIPANKEVPLSEDCFFPVKNVPVLRERIREKIQENQSHDYIHIVRELYNWDTIAEQTAEVYYEILNLKPEL
ncbi:MAG: glycosyltransferase family 4 protein [Fibrobacter sp.]|jgi:glycosyltransferase involved in cell wall biosynthesis|nr:glycosyltransferase family 4 protein [Fibrobacter sp.]